MPLYEFKCKTCAARASFGGEHDAGKAGWGMAQATHAGSLRYHVYCPQHVPEWLKVAVGAAKEKRG